MKYKRILAILLVTFCLLSCVACGGTKAEDSSAVSSSMTSSITSTELKPVSSDESTSEGNFSSIDTVSSNSSNESTVSTGSTDITSSNSSSNSSNSSSNVDTKPIDRIQKIGTVGGNGVLYKFNDNIIKLEVPFHNIYTTVFFVKINNSGDYLIIDTASNESDVQSYILPAAKALSVNLHKVVGILLTHTHGDHAGGLNSLSKQCPNATVYGVKSSNSDASHGYKQISDGTMIGEYIKVVTIKGHDSDACGYLDTRTKTLMSGDSLQLYGIASWGCLVSDLGSYVASMNKLASMDIENILTSHAYVPNGAYALGKTEVKKYIQDCIDCIDITKTFVESLYKSGVTNTAEIEKQYIEFMKETYFDFPSGGFGSLINQLIRGL